MFTTFTLLLVAGVGCRLALSWVLRAQFEVTLCVPQTLATLVLLLACLPSWLQPIPFPPPFSFTLGVLLSDLVLGRASL